MFDGNMLAHLWRRTVAHQEAVDIRPFPAAMVAIGIRSPS